MLCGARTRSGTPCKKFALLNGTGGRCRNHGGASLSGEKHPNYKHGRCTKAIRAKAREGRMQLRLLIALGNQIGMFAPMPRKRR